MTPKLSAKCISAGLILFLLLILAPVLSRAQSLDAKIEALAEQLIESDARYKDPTFQKFSERTQDRVKGIDKDLTRIELYRLTITELKRQPALNDSQLRWLVEIEDGFVAAAGRFRGARAMYIMADEFSGFPDSAGSLMAGVRGITEASRHLEKAKRDLATLRTRLDIRQEH